MLASGRLRREKNNYVAQGQATEKKNRDTDN